jgi:hypothetical protein
MVSQVINHLKWPNDKFFEINGELTDPNSLAAKAQFLMVRHSEAEHNVVYR